MADGSWSSSGMPSTRRQELLLERHEVSAVCPMHRRSGGIILAVPAYTVCRKNVSVYAVCCIPLVIDGLTQLWEWQVSTNRRRFATGVLAGYGICSMAITLLLFVKNLMLRSW